MHKEINNSVLAQNNVDEKGRLHPKADAEKLKEAFPKSIQELREIKTLNPAILMLQYYAEDISQLPEVDLTDFAAFIQKLSSEAEEIDIHESTLKYYRLLLQYEHEKFIQFTQEIRRQEQDLTLKHSLDLFLSSVSRIIQVSDDTVNPIRYNLLEINKALLAAANKKLQQMFNNKLAFIINWIIENSPKEPPALSEEMSEFYDSIMNHFKTIKGPLDYQQVAEILKKINNDAIVIFIQIIIHHQLGEAITQLQEARKNINMTTVQEDKVHFTESKRTGPSLAKKRWQFALKAIRNNVRLEKTSTPLLGLSTQAYLLEKTDPQHRRGKQLIKEFFIWKEEKTDKNFYTWLDDKEKATGQYLIRMKYRTTKDEQEQIRATFKDGNLYVEDKLYDTTHFKGRLKKPGYAAFALSEKNELFFDEHDLHKVHSSLLGGERVPAIGMMKIKNGKIVEIDTDSGHYGPGLKNLLYAAKNIPSQYFSPDARIVFWQPRFAFSRRFQNSKYRIIRMIGKHFGHYSKKKVFSPKKFISFAEKKLEISENKFIHKRDKSNNRYENSLYETLLAKTIIENNETWRPLVLKINTMIYETVVLHKSNKKMIDSLIKNLRNHTNERVDKNNYLEILKKFLFESKNLAKTVLFHADFFEIVYAAINGEKAYEKLPTYKKLRTRNLFESKNRGVQAISLTQRRIVKKKRPFYRSSALGIMPDAETPENLLHYFQGEVDKHRPTKLYHKLHGSRISYREAHSNREQKMEVSLTYRDEVISRDISLTSGTSGTTAKVITILIDIFKLNPEQIKEYLMARGGTLCAYGHHSIYEVMVLARNLGFPIEYNDSFYHQQFITPAFRNSQAYKNFLESYSDLVKNHIPQPSATEISQHSTYLKVKKAIDKEDKPRTTRDSLNLEIKSFDKSKLKKQASLNRYRFSTNFHGYKVVGEPDVSPAKKTQSL